MEAILRVALDDGVRKWVPGTILNAYPPGNQLAPGVVAGQLCIKIKTDAYGTVSELKKLRLLKKVNIDAFMSQASLEKRKQQKARLMDANRDGRTFTLDEITEPYRPDKLIDLESPGMLLDTPEKQHPSELGEDL